LQHSFVPSRGGRSTLSNSATIDRRKRNTEIGKQGFNAVLWCGRGTCANGLAAMFVRDRPLPMDWRFFCATTTILDRSVSLSGLQFQ
jgi:hypothetical protein